MPKEPVHKQVTHHSRGGGDDEPEPFRGIPRGPADQQIADAKDARDREND